MKKLVIATIVAYIVLMAANYLIHSVWLMPDYEAIASSHRTVEGIMHRFWAMALGQFFFAAMFAYIYTRGRENKPWAEQGIRYAGDSLRDRDDLYNRSALFLKRICGLHRELHAGDQVDDRRRYSTNYPRVDRGGYP
jgi:hypothetical protein